MSYGPPEPLDPPRNKHRWVAVDNTLREAWQIQRGDRCANCGITRTTRGWYFRDAWRDGPIPRCGDFVR